MTGEIAIAWIIFSRKPAESGLGPKINEQTIQNRFPAKRQPVPPTNARMFYKRWIQGHSHPNQPRSFDGDVPVAMGKSFTIPWPAPGSHVRARSVACGRIHTQPQ